MQTVNPQPSMKAKSPEEKVVALKLLFESITEKEYLNVIQEIEDLASAKEMDDFILDQNHLTSTYTYSDFLDEIFRCLRQIKLRQNNFLTKIKDICFKSHQIFVQSSDTFEVWIEDCFERKVLLFIQIVEKCGVLYSQNHQVPFAFISTQIIRLFYFPTESCLEFLRGLSDVSIEHILRSFSLPVKEILKEKIIHFASLILSDQVSIHPFHEVNNSVGGKEKSEQDTTNHMKTILDGLSFHVMPGGYFAYAHTDYQKNIYLSYTYLPKKEKEYDLTLMSIISLVHETAHVKRIESALFCSPLEFTPPSLNYEAGESIEEKLFGGVVLFRDVKNINPEKIFEHPDVNSNFLIILKDALKLEIKSKMSGSGHQNKVLSRPKD